MASSARSTESKKSRIARAELEAARTLVQLENEHYRKQKELISKQLALQKSLIEEEDDDLSQSLGSDDNSERPVQLGSLEDDRLARLKDYEARIAALKVPVESNPSMNGDGDARESQGRPRESAPAPTPQQVRGEHEYSGVPHGFVPVVTGPPTALLPKSGLEIQIQSLVKTMNQTLSKVCSSRGKIIDLPVFSGKPEEWPSFYAAFTRTTRDENYNNGENLNRLEKALKGAAREAVQFLLIDPNNVDAMIDALKRRFGSPEYIINSLIKKIENLPRLKPDDWTGLIEMSNCLLGFVSTIESTGYHSHANNPQLLREVQDKLPGTMLIEWGLYTSEMEQPSIKDISNWLLKYAEAASKLQPTYSYRDRATETKRPPKSKNVFTVHSEGPSACIMGCTENHELKNCKSFQELSVKQRWAKVKKSTPKLCFACLGPHKIEKCSEKKECNVNGCKKMHNVLLHYRNVEAQETVTQTSVLGRRVLLKVVPVTLIGPTGKHVDTYALLDEGSTITMLDRKVAIEIGAKGRTENLNLRWTDKTVKRVMVQRVGVRVRNSSGETFNLENVKVVDDLDLTSQSVRVKDLQNKWAHLRDLDLTDLQGAKPTMLIGQDQAGLILSREVIEGPGNAPIASRTKLGWTLHGKTDFHLDRIDEVVIAHVHNDDELNNKVKDHFRLENLGVKLIQLESKDVIRARQIIDETACYSEGQWRVGMLWKDGRPSIPNGNLDLAEKRFASLERKLGKDRDLGLAYKAKIDEYLQKGYAEKVTENQAEGGTWFLPHFATVNPNKAKKKIRLVFDAAAGRPQSLNDMLLPGPDLLNSLPGILFRFRSEKIAICGDIQDMFHRVVIQEEDRRLQRFLWRERNDEDIKVYQMRVLIFGASCAPYIAQEVRNRNAKRVANNYSSGAVDAVLRKHYMDDYLDSIDSEREAADRVAEVTAIHRDGGFRMRNWASNSAAVLATIPESERTEQLKKWDSDDSAVEKILGMTWDPRADLFSYECSLERVRRDQTIDKKLTKRVVLKNAMLIYDPLGLLAKVAIKVKIILQDVWRSGVDWDQELPESIACRYRKWLEELYALGGLRIPRHYANGLSQTTSVQLHVFSDASESAYAAAAYFRIEHESGIVTSLVMARSRVAPLKPVSIPRLELQAALLGCRMANTIKEEHDLQIESTTFWVDSTTVIQWIRSDARAYKQFVANRVGEILETTDPQQWRWLSTDQNVADEATRESSKSFEDQSHRRWFLGPSFLRESEENWPARDTSRSHKNPNEDLVERKTDLVGAVMAVDEDKSRKVIEVERFSSWDRLRRTVAWVLRYIENFCAKSRGEDLRINQDLTVEEIQAAERSLFRISQQESFPIERACLVAGKEIPKTSRLRTLKPMLDEEGIMRVQGRIGASPSIGEETKSPIILAPENPITKLLISFYHKNAGHVGYNTVLNELRQRFWVLKARAAVKSSWARCNECLLRRSKPKPPLMAELPLARVQDKVRPFTNCGLDFFGPLTVSVGRRQEKRWGALFTCLSTRAVHLEIVASMSTDSAIMAIRRMSNRRGYPSGIYCDNGTNLVGADRELQKAVQELDHARIESKLVGRGITFVYNPPAAPHMGGAWERLVRSVKEALGVVLRQRTLKEETLQTLFVEVENTVNSRPLTEVSLDCADEEALTPNHFLIGSSNAAHVPGNFDKKDLSLRKQWRICQALADMFWQRWLREYLPTLVKRPKWVEDQEPIRKGDVVIIADPALSRNLWPKGVVVETYPSGKDGVTRIADIKTATGIYRRPVSKLCILKFA